MEFVSLPDANNVHLWNARPDFYTPYAQEGEGYTLQSPAARLSRQHHNSGIGRFLFTPGDGVEEQSRDEPTPPAAA